MHAFCRRQGRRQFRHDFVQEAISPVESYCFWALGKHAYIGSVQSKTLAKEESFSKGRLKSCSDINESWRNEANDPDPINHASDLYCAPAYFNPTQINIHNLRLTLINDRNSRTPTKCSRSFFFDGGIHSQEEKSAASSRWKKPDRDDGEDVERSGERGREKGNRCEF